MSRPLQNRHALITGGGRGIGAAIADQLDALGARITLVGRDAAVLRAKAESLHDAQAIAIDVTDEQALGAGFGQAEQAFGAIEILINNAGAAESALLADTDTALWMRMLDVNLNAVFYSSRAVINGMRKKRWGRVVNIASSAGLKGYAYVGAYCAAKHGVVGLTRALALETARYGITVNAVCPGYTETDLVAHSLERIVAKTGRSLEQARAQLIAVNPQQRFVQPQEVADTVAWLCGENAAAITGQAIAVAGGEVM